MCRDNSFHSVKFTMDYEDISSVTMRVFLWREDIGKGKLLQRKKLARKNSGGNYAAPSKSAAPFLLL